MKADRVRFAIFLTFALLIALVAVLAPILATHDPQAAVLGDAILPPGGEHWFGTDKMGRDVYSRVIFGARTSILSALILVCGILTVGGTLGTVAGCMGGTADAVIMRIADMMVSFPGMALAIAAAGIRGPSMTSAILAILAVSWTKYARLARSLVLKIRNQDYVYAAQLSGLRKRDILCRYMLPAVLPTLLITAATDVGGMMLELAGLSFLGLGSQSTAIEWGYMLNEGRAYMESAPWLMIFPGLAIFITVVAFNLLGDSLRDLLDPRENRPVKTHRKRSGNMKHGIKAVGALLAVILLVGNLSGCGGQEESTRGEKHLNFGCYNYSDSLDPATNVNASWCGTRYGITECLFRFDNQMVAQPNLCDTYSCSEDYRTWTLHVREGVTFSNGKAVTPAAVKASLERLYAETDAQRGGTGNSNPQIYLTYDAITADDQNGTVTITCTAPTGNLPGILAYPYFAVIDAEAAENGAIIGTGPYCVKSVQPGVSIDMVQNELYWNGAVPYDTVTILFIEDSATKSMALQRGDVDVVENITTASDLQKFSADPNYHISSAAGVRTGNSYLNFRGILANDALRQAIQMALDSETMCTVTVGGMYTAGISVLPSSLDDCYDQLTNPYPYNPDAAKALLDGAGIVDTDGDGVREIDGQNIQLDYVAYSSRNLNDFAQAVALQLQDIGIGVTVTVRDYDTALALQNAGKFDLITANTTTVGTGDPQDYLGGWYSGNSQSYGYYQNDAYDGLYEELVGTMDQQRRRELIAQLQQILIDDAATIVHGYYNSRMFSRAEKVTGAEISAADYYWLTTGISPAGEESGNHA